VSCEVAEADHVNVSGLWIGHGSRDGHNVGTRMRGNNTQSLLLALN
jgi:hypothetical protein